MAAQKRKAKEQEWFEWTVKFLVHKTWIEDGFDLTDERALEMLSRDLRYAHIASELGAKVIRAPDAKAISRAQGSES